MCKDKTIRVVKVGNSTLNLLEFLNSRKYNQRGMKRRS